MGPGKIKTHASTAQRWVVAVLCLVAVVCVVVVALGWHRLQTARGGGALGPVLRSPDGQWLAVLRTAENGAPMRVLVQLQDVAGTLHGEEWVELWPGAYDPAWHCPGGRCTSLQLSLALPPEQGLALPPGHAARLRAAWP